MFKTIEGIYRNRNIELAEHPSNIGDQVQVLVTFLDGNNNDVGKIRQLIDRLETIAGIQQGFEELAAGQTRPVSEFEQEMKQKLAENR